MSDLIERNSRRAPSRTLNNNIKVFRRRSRIGRIKSNAGMPDAEREEREKEETPRLSPVPEDKTPRVKPERQYSRDVLIQLMTTPLSTAKHPCLESTQNKSLVSTRGVMRWLEDRWIQRQHADSLTDEDRSDGSLDPQKAQKWINDPKAERLRKEQEVVLSPQRRSFNSGCFVNQPQAGQRRPPDSPPLGIKAADREASHRDMAPTRRIGSGRIMRDPVWDCREKDESGTNTNHNHDFNFRQRDDRFERRLYERSHDKERGPQRNYRHNNDRRKNEPDEPEWFSGGPTSQHDTIELHGFDGPTEEKVSAPKKQSKNNRNNNKNRKNSDATSKSENSNGKKISSRKSSPEVPNVARSLSPPAADNEKQPIGEKRKKSQGLESVVTRPKEAEPEGKEPDCVFDLEDILNFDALPPLLNISNGCPDEVGTGSGSRFSQFFRKESPSPQPKPKMEKTKGKMINSTFEDIRDTNVFIPPDCDTYFAPISPVAPSKAPDQTRAPSSLLELLQGGGSGAAGAGRAAGGPPNAGRTFTKKPSLRDLETCGKLQSLEEVEARLRGERGGQPLESSAPHPPPNKEEEVAVFRKLMMSKQLQNNHESKPPSHAGMPGGFTQQQPPPSQHGINQHQPPMPIPHELVMKLLHVQQQQRQQDMLNQLLAPGGTGPSQFSVPPPPLSPDPPALGLPQSQVNMELLHRPDAQQLLRSLKRGEMSVLQLLDQMRHVSNPLQHEMITTVIKAFSLVQPVQREPSPADQLMHQMRQAPHQQLRVPSPHGNVLQRVPSPRELVAHTQNILQNALLKKKLEEQKENYRKRQELQRSHSPNVSTSGAGGVGGTMSPKQNTTSPTPLAFTPTSVLRKMTADKEEHPPKLGRAIVKGNNNISMPPLPPPDHQFMQQMKGAGPGPGPRGKMGGSGGNMMMGVNRGAMQHPPPPPNRGPGRNMGAPNNMMPQHGLTQSVQQLLMNHNYNAHRNNPALKQEVSPMARGGGGGLGTVMGNLGRHSGGGGGYPPARGGVGRPPAPASPVSNQLARWFSPELLAQARAGQLPDMPPVSPTQNMLSVEEIERLQQAVHN